MAQQQETPQRTGEANILHQLGEGPVLFQQQFIGVVMTSKGFRFVRYATSPNHKKCFAKKTEPIERINNFLKTLVQEQIPYDLLLHIQYPFERMSVWTWVPLHEISELSLEVLWNLPGRATLEESRSLSPTVVNKSLDQSNTGSMRITLDNVLTPDVTINSNRLLIRCTGNENPLNRYTALATEVLIPHWSSEAETETKIHKSTLPKVSQGCRALRKCGFRKNFTRSSGQVKRIGLSPRGFYCIKYPERKRPRIDMTATLMSSAPDMSPESVPVIDVPKKSAACCCVLGNQHSCVGPPSLACSVSGRNYDPDIVDHKDSTAHPEHLVAEAQGRHKAPDISTEVTHDLCLPHPASDNERHPFGRLASMCGLM